MRNNLVYTLAIIILLSCSKQELAPAYTEAPLYFLKGTVDGVVFEFSVGRDSMLLQTPILEQMGERIWGSILNPEIPGLATAFQIIIANHITPFGNQATDLPATIDNGSYNYMNAITDILVTQRVSKTSVTYIDLQGFPYFTSLQFQLPSSSFDITDVSDVEHDGKQYRMTTLDINCQAYSIEKNDTVQLNISGEILFGGI